MRRYCFRLFPSKTRYFTNGYFASLSHMPGSPFRLTSWSPIAPSKTFDTGIVLVSEQQISIVWAAADD